MTSQPTNHLRRALLGGLAALSVAAGSGLALAPRDAHAVRETSQVLYTLTLQPDSNEAQLRQDCRNTAPYYNVDRAQATIREHTHTGTHGGGQTFRILTCTGYTRVASTVRAPGGGVLTQAVP